MPDYIPQTDAGFRAWAVNYAYQLSLNPTAYMLTPPQSAVIQAAVDEFVEKYEITLNPDTKTKTTVIAKDNARSAAEAMCRDFAMLIKENLGDVAGATPVSAQLTTPTTLTLTYSESIAAATEVNIPFQDPALRNAVGGFVADSTFPIAA